MKMNVFFVKKIIVFVGVCLLAGAIVIMSLWRWNIIIYETKSKNYVDTLRAMIPEPQNAVPEERRDNTMSVLSVDGIDFVGLIELPRYDTILPICNVWGKTSKYPCRFDGSIYDSTMQIGATTQKGQYDFYRDLSVGDTVNFLDVEGNKYTFKIADFCVSKHVNKDTLRQKEAKLTLFIKNIYSFEYLIVFCDASL